MNYNLFRRLAKPSATPGNENDFKAKVERVMAHEKDFTCLYDYDIIATLSPQQLQQYLKEIIKNYIIVKDEILRERGG